MQTLNEPRRPAIGWQWLTALLSAGVALAAFRYVTDSPARVPAILANAYAQPFLPLHATSAGIALLLGPVQLLRGLRLARPGAHRIVGRAYVAACLAGAVTGAPLAMGSTAGPIATGGFLGLSVAWFAATMIGWRRAVQGQIAAHRLWMLRSWAMTFSAVTLRLFLAIIPVLGIPFLDGYRFIAWGCWIGNLLVLELWLRMRQRPGPLHVGAAIA